MPMQRMLNYSSIFINLGPEPLKFTSQDYPAKTKFSLPVGLDLSDKALGSLGFFVSTLYHTSQIRPFVSSPPPGLESAVSPSVEGSSEILSKVHFIHRRIVF